MMYLTGAFARKHTLTFGKAILGAVVFIASMGSANAAFITGNMGLTGSYTASGGTDLSDATILDLGSATGTSGTGDIGGTVGFGTAGTVNNSPFTFNPSTAVVNLLTIGGWQLDLGTTTIVDQTVSLLTLSGTGAISGNGFTATPATWTFSSQGSSSYSMTVSASAVPVPAAVWLFGSGLLGLVGIARRKAA